MQGGFEIDQRYGFLQRAVPGEGVESLIDKRPEVGGKRRCRMVERPERGAEGLEDSGMGRQFDQRVAPLQVADHDAVQRPAPDKGDPLARGRFEELVDLFGHHEAEPGDDIGLGLPLVEGVGAVALAEYAAPPGYAAGISLHAKRYRFVERKSHSPYLLEKKLAGSGSALVARKHSAQAARAINSIGKLGLASGAYHRLRECLAFVNIAERILHGLRLGKGRERYAAAERPPGDRYPVERALLYHIRQQVKEQLLRLSFMRTAE